MSVLCAGVTFFLSAFTGSVDEDVTRGYGNLRDPLTVQSLGVLTGTAMTTGTRIMVLFSKGRLML